MENPFKEQSTDTKEKPKAVMAFTAFTGVETTENDEVMAFRTSVVREAEKFLKPFMEKGLISKRLDIRRNKNRSLGYLEKLDSLRHQSAQSI